MSCPLTLEQALSVDVELQFRSPGNGALPCQGSAPQPMLTPGPAPHIPGPQDAAGFSPAHPFQDPFQSLMLVLAEGKPLTAKAGCRVPMESIPLFLPVDTISPGAVNLLPPGVCLTPCPTLSHARAEPQRSKCPGPLWWSQDDAPLIPTASSKDQACAGPGISLAAGMCLQSTAG